MPLRSRAALPQVGDHIFFIKLDHTHHSTPHGCYADTADGTLPKFKQMRSGLFCEMRTKQQTPANSLTQRRKGKTDARVEPVIPEKSGPRNITIALLLIVLTIL